jgi:hypothetical protein
MQLTQFAVVSDVPYTIIIKWAINFPEDLSSESLVANAQLSQPCNRVGHVKVMHILILVFILKCTFYITP